MELLFGYRNVVGLPRLCPCRDPGDYICCEQPTIGEPLLVVLRCWCGRTARMQFDNLMEKAKFLEMNGVVEER